MKRNQIYGLIMRPSCGTVEDHEKTFQSTDYSVKNNFYDNYSNHIVAMEIVVGCAKHYILNNYKKITDWSDLNVIVEDNNRKKDYIEYFNYKEPRTRRKITKSNSLEKILDRIDKEDKTKHNPVITLTDCVLDSSDGDFSLTINGRNHLWISDDTVIIIANYIETVLNKNEQ